MSKVIKHKIIFVRCNLIRAGRAQKSFLDISENKKKPPEKGVRFT